MHTAPCTFYTSTCMSACPCPSITSIRLLTIPTCCSICSSRTRSTGTSAACRSATSAAACACAADASASNARRDAACACARSARLHGAQTDTEQCHPCNNVVCPLWCVSRHAICAFMAKVRCSCKGGLNCHCRSCKPAACNAPSCLSCEPHNKSTAHAWHTCYNVIIPVMTMQLPQPTSPPAQCSAAVLPQLPALPLPSALPPALQQPGQQHPRVQTEWSLAEHQIAPAAHCW